MRTHKEKRRSGGGLFVWFFGYLFVLFFLRSGLHFGYVAACIKVFHMNAHVKYTIIHTYVCSTSFRIEEKHCLHCEHPLSSTPKSSMAIEGIWAHSREGNP